MYKFIFVILLVAVFEAVNCTWNEYNPSGTSADRYHHGFERINGNTAILIGGVYFNNNPGSTAYMSDVVLYNADTNTYSAGADSGAVRAYFSTGIYNGNIIVFAGEKSPNPPYGDYNDTRRYNIATNTWSVDDTNSLTYHVTQPNGGVAIFDALARQWHSSVVFGDALYVFGGYLWGGINTVNDVLQYNITTKTWSFHFQNASSSTAPLHRQGHTVNAYTDATRGDSLIIFGGYSDVPANPGYNDVWQYVISSKSWRNLTPSSGSAPAGRYGHSSAINNGVLYIYGGLSTNWGTGADTYYGDVWSFDLSAGTWTNVYTPQPYVSTPGARQSATATFFNGNFYIFGGYEQYVGLENDVWVWSS